MAALTATQRNHIAMIIKSKRKQLYGYTGGNRDLAVRIGVSPQLLSMWARNKRTPNPQELLILSEVFDMPLDDLCRLNRRKQKRSNGGENTPSAAMNPEEARTSMLKVCDIATDLVNRQRQMLRGELDIRAHKKMLSRIKKFVDTVE